MHSKQRRRAAGNIVGDRIKEARKLFDTPLTQDQLSGRLAADKVLLDRASIAKIENGIRCVYDFEVLGLAKALKVDVRWLLGLRGCLKSNSREAIEHKT
jgi:HTH-type transcriptional regulator, cell division transcriptional repressor